jgi:hypothetical protein
MGLRALLAMLSLCCAVGERFPIKILHDSARDSGDGLPLGSIYRLNALDIDGNMVALSKFAGKVVLVVNLASK